MIFGINFNGTPIPEGYKRKFAAEIRIKPPMYGLSKPVTASLKGVCNTAEERDIMLVVANNGHRCLHVVERNTPAGIWYGIYSYYV